MTNSTINKIILSATTAMFLTACGGGGGSTELSAKDKAMEVIKTYADDGKKAPTVADYRAAGVTGVTNDNVNAMNILVDGKKAKDVDTLAELTTLVSKVPVVVKDSEAPVITLAGDATVTFVVGSAYTDEGVTISDNIDTNLEAVVTGDTVDKDVVATYVIKYNVTDAAGNEAVEVTRTVIVTAVPNAVPVATAQAVPVTEDTIDNEITLAGTDTDTADTLTYAIATAPAHGTATIDANVVKYTPEADYFGTDTFTFTVNDGKIDSAEATVTITVADVPEIISPLKTGQTVSYDVAGAEDTSILDDGHYQKGVTPSYTRDAETNTTTDNLTGLVWEDNKRNAELVTKGSDIATFCTDKGAGWRIPTVSELKTLVNYSRVTPAIDTAAFVNIGIASSKYYRTLNVAGTGDPFAINFKSGENKGKKDARYIRCVKGESAIETDFTRDNDTNTVTDNFRKLVWEDHTIGTEDSERKTWIEAINYCEGLDGAWRLPSINELETISDRKGGNYTNDTFKYVSSHPEARVYWSSTTFGYATGGTDANPAEDPEKLAWTIAYKYGSSTMKTKESANSVRCVKDLVE